MPVRRLPDGGLSDHHGEAAEDRGEPGGEQPGGQRTRARRTPWRNSNQAGRPPAGCAHPSAPGTEGAAGTRRPRGRYPAQPAVNRLLRMAMVTAVETRPGANPDRASFTTALKPRARSSPQPAASASPVPLTCPASSAGPSCPPCCPPGGLATAPARSSASPPATSPATTAGPAPSPPSPRFTSPSPPRRPARPGAGPGPAPTTRHPPGPVPSRPPGGSASPP
jgi:hypothetical protein